VAFKFLNVLVLNIAEKLIARWTLNINQPFKNKVKMKSLIKNFLVSGHNEPDTEIKVYHDISLKVLKVVYLKFSQIYKNLFQITVQHQTPSQEEV
jgi:hypothetical protein